MERKIHVQWSGPISSKDLDGINDRQHDYGLYQVYAHHPVSGAGTLVYIGMAFDQTLGVRIKQHRWETGSEPDPENVVYHIGRFTGLDAITSDQWKKDILMAEKILIHEHAPAYNSTHMMQIHNEAEVQDVRVINFGAVRSLKREVSGYMGSVAAKTLSKAPPYSKADAAQPSDQVTIEKT